MEVNSGQRGAVVESPRPNGGDRIGDDNLCQRVAVLEGPITDGGDSIANDSISQRGAVVESIVSNGGDRIGDNNLCQRGAVVESTVSDGGDRIGNDNLRQRTALVESPLSNGGNKVGDGVGGLRFSGGIGMEQSSILGEENSLYCLIRGILLADLNFCQRVTGVESPACDGGDPTAKSDTGQRVTARKSRESDSGDRIGDDNLCQRGAVSIVMDSGIESKPESEEKLLVPLAAGAVILKVKRVEPVSESIRWETSLSTTLPHGAAGNPLHVVSQLASAPSG